MKSVLSLFVFLFFLTQSVFSIDDGLSVSAECQICDDSMFVDITIINNLEVDSTNENDNNYFIPLSDWAFIFGSPMLSGISNIVSFRMGEFSTVTFSIKDYLEYCPIFCELEPKDTLFVHTRTNSIDSIYIYRQNNWNKDSINGISITYYNLDDYCRLNDQLEFNLWDMVKQIRIWDIDLEEYYKLWDDKTTENKYYSNQKLTECEKKLIQLGYTGRKECYFDVEILECFKIEKE